MAHVHICTPRYKRKEVDAADAQVTSATSYLGTMRSCVAFPQASKCGLERSGRAGRHRLVAGRPREGGAVVHERSSRWHTHPGVQGLRFKCRPQVR